VGGTITILPSIAKAEALVKYGASVTIIAPDITINQMNWVVPGAARGLFADLKPFIDRGQGSLVSKIPQI
jgi:hypothetical protein